MASTSLSQLRDHLKDMFQFDNELDVGIYKVLKLKRKEVSAFLDEELESVVSEVFNSIERADTALHVAELTRFVIERGGADELRWLEDVSAHEDDLKDFIEYKLRDDEKRRDELLIVLDAAGSQNGSVSELEDRVYNHLIAFFGRYYRNGDFGYNDRSLASFKVDYPPAEADYDGSDVLLHWKHRGSYYVKSASSFPTVRFDLDGETIEYRLETSGDESVARNDNKENVKHYRLDRIEKRDDGVWQVTFHLAPSSTPKTEIFPRLMEEIFEHDDELGKYLYRKPGKKEEKGKPIFSDLEGDFDKIQNGQLKGQGSGTSGLRISFERYREYLADRDEFKDLGSNKPDRVKALEGDETAFRLYTLDKHLNTFYVGVDADYFIHKDLKGFLTREAERYVKDVVLGGVSGIFRAAEDTTALRVAEAFYRVAERLVELLAAVEEFQKNLFLLKKKVVQTEYLVSIGKLEQWIPDAAERSAVLQRIHDNEGQRKEWKSVFGVEVGDPSQYLLLHRTLPIDTRHYDDQFKFQLLGSCPDLEQEVEGLLLKSENLQALRLLADSYRGKAHCVYIDPPYNTGGDDFLYKDSFRHSSWLSMIQDRIEEGAELMADDAALFASIDDDEQARLKLALDGVFGYTNFVNAVIWQKKFSPANDAKWFSDDHDYLLAYAKNKEIWKPNRLPRTPENNRGYSNPDNDPRGRWMSGDYTSNKSREERPGLWYSITNPTTGEEIWPSPSSVWRYTPDQHAENVNDNRVWWGADGTNSMPRFKRFLSEVPGIVPRTIWSHQEAGHNQEATQELRAILGGGNFSSPKPTRLVKRVLTVAPGRIVLDFFAGSGTTGDAVFHKNKEDEGNRQFILVEMGDYFDRVLLERIRRVMYSQNWRDGKPKSDAVDGTVSVVKYQRLEQYEDVLDALAEQDDTRPQGVALRYLYRPEEQRIRQSLNLTDPFENRIEIGAEHEPMTVDVLETFAYLAGLPIQRVGARMFEDDEQREYRWFRSGRHLVVFRPIKPGEDDTDNLNAMLADHPDAEVLYVNEYADERQLKGVSVRIVTVDDFDKGASWS